MRYLTRGCRASSGVALGISIIISCGYADAFLQHPTNIALHSNPAKQPVVHARNSCDSVPCSSILDVEQRSHALSLLRMNADNSDESESEVTDGDNNNDAEGLPERPPPKPKNIWQTVFDPIVTSPILPFILIWGPFLQNPYNKRKWAELTADANPIVVNGFLGTVAFSIVSYFVYNARVEAAEEASEIRELALRDLRTARQGQFTSNKNQQTTSDAVQEAASAYEEALRKEMQLRWISPQLGWRLDFPDDPASREEDKAAAKQFLGLEITDDGNIVELN